MPVPFKVEIVSDELVVSLVFFDEVEQRMRELAEQALPIEKRSVDIEDAIAFLKANGMEDKARILKYRISSRVNLYTLDGFTDYFYGYMVPDTGYLKWFALEPFEDGFILRLPALENPEQVGAFTPSMKVFRAMHDAEGRTASMDIPNVGEMDDIVASGNATQLILAHEALMEKRIGDIAEEIAARKDVRFVMIAGPSSSGKTTFSHRLSTQLLACGLRPHPIATDNYFRNREDTPKDANGQYDFEGLGAMDVEQFNSDMSRLLKGETVDMPTYNFKKGVREYNGDKLTLGPGDVLVIEGIHCLNDEFSHSLPKESKYKIYISCLTTLNIDDHNRIPTTDARLLRRIERDARTRGYGAQATIKMWPSVRRGEEQNIFPYQDSADMVFNSALLYETALLVSAALLLATILIYAMRAQVETLTGIPVSVLFAPARIWAPLSVILLVFLLSSLIPALLFASVSVQAAFRNGSGNRRRWKQLLLAIELICVSFVTVFVLITGLQFRHMVSLDMGYQHDRLIYTELKTDSRTANLYREALRSLPEVERVGVSLNMPLHQYQGNLCTDGATNNTLFSSRTDMVDTGYLATMGIKLVAGRNFTDGTPYDQVIVNEL